MNISLTGSHGFIGRHLYQHLKNSNHQVDCWDIQIQKNIEDFTISDNTNLIIHLAALAGVRESIQKPNEYWQNNVINTKKIFEQAEKTNTRIIYASSSSCLEWYNNPYAMTKFVTEFIAPKNSVGLRFSTVWGDGARGNMLIPQIQNKTLQYATTHKRDFIHVNDVVSAIHTIINHPEERGIFEVGTGQAVSVDQLVAFNGLDVPIKDGYEYEAKENLLPSYRLRSLGWEPKKFIMEEIL